MATENKTGFEVGANINPFEQSMGRMVAISKDSQRALATDFGRLNSQMAQIGEAFARVGEQIKQSMVEAGKAIRKDLSESMNSAFESIKQSSKMTAIVISAAFAAIGLGAIYSSIKLIMASAGFIKGLFTGDSYKSEDINKTKEAIAATQNLRIQLNLTQEAASAMSLAFNAAGTSSSGYIQTAATLFGAVKGNNAALQLLGVDVRRTGDDVADLDRINKSAVLALEKYRSGTERSAAAAAAGLPSYEALKDMQKTTTVEFAKSHEQARLYGLVISDEVVAAANDYDAAILEFNNNSKLTWDGMSRSISDGVMPILTDLAIFFKDGFPQIAASTRAVVATLVSGYHIMATGIYTVTEVILGSIKALGEGIAGIGGAIAAVMRGDFSGAWDAIKQSGRNAVAEMGNSFDNIAAHGERASQRMRLAWMGGQDGETSSLPAGGNKTWVPPKDADKPPAKNAAPETSAVPSYEAALAARKIVFEKENTLREFSKQQELDYWKGVLADDEISSKDRIKILIKTGKLELDILRQNAKDKAQIQQLHAEDYKAQTLDYVTELEARAAFERDMGTTTQADYLARQQGFNQLRLQAEMDFIQQKIAVAQNDPEANMVELEKLEMQKLEIKRKYRALEMDLNRQQALESTTELRSMFGGIQSGWSASIKGMLNGTKTLGQGLQGMFQAVGDAVTSMLAEMAAKWLIQQALMMVFGKTAAISTIAEKSAEAGAGGVASMAAAPWPLNMSAPAFGAAMAMAAASFGAVASASQGFDIPAGLNPLTQLHEQEMVLPAKHANVIRGLADGGQGAAGGAGTVVMNITTPNADSFRRSQRQIQRAQEQALSSGRG